VKPKANTDALHERILLKIGGLRGTTKKERRSSLAETRSHRKEQRTERETQTKMVLAVIVNSRV
jgi:hypothetical protein